MLNKKSEVTVMIQFIMELILISIFGIFLIHYMSTWSSLEGVRQRIITRELALLVGTIHAGNDAFSYNYTYYGRTEYDILNIDHSLNLAQRNKNPVVRFPFLLSKGTYIYFKKSNLEKLIISLDNNNLKIAERND